MIPLLSKFPKNVQTNFLFQFFSLLSDKRGNLWMFAGYSLHHQALNDIRQFDTRNSSWMQVCK